MALSSYRSWLAEEIREEAYSQGYAHVVLRVLELRGVHIPDEARGRIDSCTNLALLETWLTRALTAASAAEIFAEDDA